MAFCAGACSLASINSAGSGCSASSSSVILNNALFQQGVLSPRARQIWEDVALEIKSRNKEGLISNEDEAFISNSLGSNKSSVLA